MTSLRSESELKRQYENAAQIGLRNACKEAEAKYDLPAGLMLAIASRETEMRNINGDGGHGRGVFQIDDRYHQPFLRKHGSPPPVAEAAMYAASLIASNLRYAKDQGVPEKDRLRVAVAGYNAGMGGAMTGYRAGAVDSRTTGDNYSSDVLSRRRTIVGFLPSAGSGGGKNGDRFDSDGRGQSNGTGGAQAPPPKQRSGTVPASRGEKLVLNPDQMRSVASFLNRAGNEFEQRAAQLRALPRPDMPPLVRAQVADELAGALARMRLLYPPAEDWSQDLKRRANRVDQPAGAGKRPSKAHIRRQPLLQRGATGATVKLLQRLLNKLGFGPLAVDGIFGPLTQAAVQRYQRKKGLAADGVVGQKTWSALLGQPITTRPAPGAAPRPQPGAGGGPTPKGFLGDVVKLARTQLGYTAGYDYGLSNKFAAWAGRGGPSHAEHWCADFVSWVWAKADKPIGPNGKGFAAVSQWIAYFKANGDWHSAPKVGAAVHFDWGARDGGTDHIGIVSRIEGGTVYYISGNTGQPGGGHVGVYEKSVPLGNVIGYGYP